MIYAYRDMNPDYIGLLKVGYTEKDADQQVAQQYPTKRPDGNVPYEIVYRTSAMREDCSCFTDHDVHRMFRRKKITAYFRAAKQDAPDRAPKFLWNAKMRFGKTFAPYELAKRWESALLVKGQ